MLGQLLVGQLGAGRLDLRQLRARGPESALGRAGQAAKRPGPHGEQPLLRFTRSVPHALGDVMHRGELPPPVMVDGQLEGQPQGAARVRRQLPEGPLDDRARVQRTAAHPLGERDSRHQRGAFLDGVGRQPRGRLLERLEGLVVGAGVGHRAGRLAQKRQAPLVVFAGRQQPGRRQQPPAGGLGRARGRIAPGLHEQRDRLLVARHGRALDVMRAHRRGSMHRGQRGGRSGVGADPPPLRDRVVHGPAHDRVAEAETPRSLCGADEVELDQLVDRGEDVALGLLGDRTDELGLERLARHRGRLKRPARIGPGGDQLLPDRGDDRPGNRAAGSRRSRSGLQRMAAAGPGQLLYVEGVATALAADRRAGGLVEVVADQLLGVLGGQRGELESGTEAAAGRSLEGAGEPRRVVGGRPGRSGAARGTGAPGG